MEELIARGFPGYGKYSVVDVMQMCAICTSTSPSRISAPERFSLKSSAPRQAVGARRTSRGTRAQLQHNDRRQTRLKPSWRRGHKILLRTGIRMWGICDLLPSTDDREVSAVSGDTPGADQLYHGAAVAPRVPLRDLTVDHGAPSRRVRRAGLWPLAQASGSCQNGPRVFGASSPAADCTHISARLGNRTICWGDPHFRAKGNRGRPLVIKQQATASVTMDLEYDDFVEAAGRCYQRL